MLDTKNLDVEEVYLDKEGAQHLVDQVKKYVNEKIEDLPIPEPGTEGYEYNKTFDSFSVGERGECDAAAENSLASGYNTKASGRMSSSFGTGEKCYLGSVYSVEQDSENPYYYNIRINSISGIDSYSTALEGERNIFPGDIIYNEQKSADKGAIVTNLSSPVGPIYIRVYYPYGSYFCEEGDSLSICFGNSYGENAVSMGKRNRAIGENSHAFGENTVSIGHNSKTEGRGALALGNMSCAEGVNSHTMQYIGGRLSMEENSTVLQAAGAYDIQNLGIAVGDVVGYASPEISPASNNIDIKTATVLSIDTIQNSATLSRNIGTFQFNSYVINFASGALGTASHAEGCGTVTQNYYEHAEGQSNVSHSEAETGPNFGYSGNTLHSIGIGSSSSDRKNAFEVMQNGDIYIIGVGGYDGRNISTAQTLQQVLSNI